MNMLAASAPESEVEAGSSLPGIGLESYLEIIRQKLGWRNRHSYPCELPSEPSDLVEMSMRSGDIR